MKTTNIYIIGFMGSGKTTVGRRLAKQLNYAFADLDDLIQQAENKSISNIFLEEGEDYFRQIEKLHLKKTFTYTATVISCGGGTPCFFNNMNRMNEHGITIYLEMNMNELYSRLKNVKEERPLLKGKSDADLLSYIEEKLSERDVFYSQATCIIRGLNVKTSELARLINGEF